MRVVSKTWGWVGVQRVFFCGRKPRIKVKKGKINYLLCNLRGTLVARESRRSTVSAPGKGTSNLLG